MHNTEYGESKYEWDLLYKKKREKVVNRPYSTNQKQNSCPTQNNNECEATAINQNINITTCQLPAQEAREQLPGRA